MLALVTKVPVAPDTGLAALPWRIDQPCPYPLDQRAHLKASAPPGQTSACVLVSWVHTSSVHAYPVVHNRGPWDECEDIRVASNYPQQMRTYQAEDMPSAY